MAQISYIDDEFTIAKLIGKKNAVDSVNLDIIQFQGNAAARDSLLAALNSGKTAADVADTPGVLDSRSNLWQPRLPTMMSRLASLRPATATLSPTAPPTWQASSV